MISGFKFIWLIDLRRKRCLFNNTHFHYYAKGYINSTAIICWPWTNQLLSVVFSFLNCVLDLEKSNHPTSRWMIAYILRKFRKFGFYSLLWTYFWLHQKNNRFHTFLIGTIASSHKLIKEYMTSFGWLYRWYIFYFDIYSMTTWSQARDLKKTHAQK